MKRWLNILTLATILVLSFAQPVYADTANPDSPPSVDQKYVYRNLLETGDVLYVWYANIPYATPPSTPVTETFIWRLYDGAILLGSTVGSAYQKGGYGYNVYSMYFDNTTAPTWGSTYDLHLNGNPTVFLSPPEYLFQINASAYTSLTDQVDTQVALATTILALATDLNTQWALAAAYYLTEEGTAATILSLYGQAVFRSAIYGLQGMAPALFEYVIGDINAPDRTWATTYSDNLTNQWAGTWVQTAQEGWKLFFGVTWDLGSLLLILFLAGLAVLGSVMISKGNIWGALIDASVVLVAATRMGLLNHVTMAAIAAVCLIYIGLELFHPLRG